MKKCFVFLLLSLFFVSCGFKNQTEEESTCVFDAKKDQLIIKNSEEKYELQIYLYGNKLYFGEYQILETDGEELLEGVLIKNNISRDIKTTLYIINKEDEFKATGSAQLYKANSLEKSDEILDFSYTGKLLRK